MIIIRQQAYGLETNDPWLAELVRRADAGETIIGGIDFSQSPEAEEDILSEEKIQALAEIICRASDEASAALFVLMGTVEIQRIRKHLRIRESTLLLLVAVR